MTTSTQTIDHATLVKLVAAGALHGADVLGSDMGWGVVLRYGNTASALAARRGTTRRFRNFETLVRYLKGLGISQYQVDARGFDPTTAKAKRVRPDASERMRNAFEAKAEVELIRRKVASSLADTRPNRPHAEVMAELQTMIDAKRLQHAQAKA